MQILFYFVIVIHVIVSLFLIGVVLLQQGRSADLAGAFGGQGSQTAFGPRAAANVLTRLTTWSAIIFMITSLSLTVLFVRSGQSHSVLDDIKPASSSAPAKPAQISSALAAPQVPRQTIDGLPLPLLSACACGRSTMNR